MTHDRQVNFIDTKTHNGYDSYSAYPRGVDHLMLKLKWFIYTVLIGLIPVGARFIVVLVSPKANNDMLWNETDFASFGLALNISNISVLEHEDSNRQWKTIVNGLSVILLVFIALVFALSFMKEIDPSLISMHRLKQTSFLLASTSFVLSSVVYDRLGSRRTPRMRS